MDLGLLDDEVKVKEINQKDGLKEVIFRMMMLINNIRIRVGI